LRFNGSTRISDINIHQISDPIPKWKDFVEILFGKWREDVLYGTIYNLYILLFLIYNIFVTAYCTYIFKLQFQVITDVIGVLDEIGYTQPTKGSRKVQVNFILKDLR
jgi:hypothetical protein